MTNLLLTELCYNCKKKSEENGTNIYKFLFWTFGNCLSQFDLLKKSRNIAKPIGMSVFSTQVVVLNNHFALN